MHNRISSYSSWRQLLAAPASASHIVQLYDSDPFLERAVAHFTAEGLQRGEAVLLTGTAAHLAGIRRELALAGVDAEAASRNGQLLPTDVEQALTKVAPGGRLDEAGFECALSDALGQAAGGGRFSGARWWGEITNTLHHRGFAAAGLAAEHLANAAAKRHGIAILCSFQCDKFSPGGYDDEGALKEMCCVHSHVIPAEDYVRHRLAVNRAITEVLGDVRGTLLQSLASWQGIPADLPSSQALLFWVRDAAPQHFDSVLERARAYQQEGNAA